jgi:uncharacterized protein
MSTQPPAPAAAPALPGGPRSSVVDAVRGFALLGIILVNANFFAFRGTEPPLAPTMADGLALWSVATLAQGKFFLIFSFLFGFGFAVLLGRSAARGEGVDYSYLRRLLGLLAFGVANAVLLFFGDILVLYALLGFVLWLLRNRSDRTLLILAGLSMAIAIASQVLILTADLSEGAAPAGAGPGFFGSFWQVAEHRIGVLPLAGTVVALFNGPAAFAMFLLGFVATRRGLFPLVAEKQARLRRPAFLAFAVAALGSGVAATALVGGVQVAAPAKLAAAITLSALAPLLSLAMVVGAFRLAARHAERRPVRALAVVGRNTLSGYLLHAVLLGAVFYGWGLGQYEKLAPAAVLVVALTTFAAIAVLLGAWSQWFRYGPAEWLLRSFTTLSAKPLLRRGRRVPADAEPVLR